MPFCSQCGTPVTQEMAFCPGCGSRLKAAAKIAVPAPQPASQTIYSAPICGAADSYKVILVNRGICRLTAAEELLEDILGYSSVEARRLLHSAPAEIAGNLTLEQAQCVAQALTEYGMEVSISNESGTYIDMNNFAAASVFDSRGDFLPAVAGVLAMLTAANRVRRIAQWNMRGTQLPLFRLGFRRPTPPPHFRRAPRHPAPRPMNGLFGRPIAPAAPPRRPVPPVPRGPHTHGGRPFRGPGGGRGPGFRGRGW